MLDAISLDQLRVFISAVDEGSFSAAARRHLRAQSVISELIGSLEAQIGVSLFDRSGRYPKLTPEGTVLLADAREVISRVDALKARARGMASGLEAELSVVVDVFFPMVAMTDAAKAFRERFPGTPLRLFVEALGGAFTPVLDGSASLGIVGPAIEPPRDLTTEPLIEVAFVMVAAHDHPLARISGPLSRSDLERHVQLVLTDRSTLSQGRGFGVFSNATWRIADLFAKHAFLLNGLGWGGMPLHTVRSDLDEGRLVQLLIEGVPEGGLLLDMRAVYPTAAPPGPAGRWLIERLRQLSIRTSPEPPAWAT